VKPQPISGVGSHNNFEPIVHRADRGQRCATFLRAAGTSGPSSLRRERIGSSALRVVVRLRGVNFRRTRTRRILVFGRLRCFRNLCLLGRLLGLGGFWCLGCFGRLAVARVRRMASFGRLTCAHHGRKSNGKSKQEEGEPAFHARSPYSQFLCQEIKPQCADHLKEKKRRRVRCPPEM